MIPIPCPSIPCETRLETGEFKWADPVSDEDGRMGSVCVRTKIWAPASQLVFGDEGPVLAILHEPSNNRPKRFTNG